MTQGSAPLVPPLSPPLCSLPAFICAAAAWLAGCHSWVECIGSSPAENTPYAYPECLCKFLCVHARANNVCIYTTHTHTHWYTIAEEGRDGGVASKCIQNTCHACPSRVLFIFITQSMQSFAHYFYSPLLARNRIGGHEASNLPSPTSHFPSPAAAVPPDMFNKWQKLSRGRIVCVA